MPSRSPRSVGMGASITGQARERGSSRQVSAPTICRQPRGRGIAARELRGHGGIARGPPTRLGRPFDRAAGGMVHMDHAAGPPARRSSRAVVHLRGLPPAVPLTRPRCAEGRAKAFMELADTHGGDRRAGRVDTPCLVALHQRRPRWQDIGRRRRPAGEEPPRSAALPSSGRDQGRISNTWLKGVSAARRKLVKPAAVATSRSLASPACAPSASPTSCDSALGTHSSVENE